MSYETEREKVFTGGGEVCEECKEPAAVVYGYGRIYHLCSKHYEEYCEAVKNMTVTIDGEEGNR